MKTAHGFLDSAEQEKLKGIIEIKVLKQIEDYGEVAERLKAAAC